MSIFAVGHHFNFRIERSITGGIWLDGGEWEQLKSRNFHDELHLVFSASWQRKERSTKLNQTVETAFRVKLGDTLYERILRLNEDLENHPFRNEAIALICRKRP